MTALTVGWAFTWVPIAHAQGPSHEGGSRHEKREERRAFTIGFCVGQKLEQQGITLPVNEERAPLDESTRTALKGAMEICRSEISEKPVASPSPSPSPSQSAAPSPSPSAAPSPSPSVLLPSEVPSVLPSAEPSVEVSLAPGGDVTPAPTTTPPDLGPTES